MGSWGLSGEGKMLGMSYERLVFKQSRDSRIWDQGWEGREVPLKDGGLSSHNEGAGKAFRYWSSEMTQRQAPGRD